MQNLAPFSHASQSQPSAWLSIVVHGSSIAFNPKPLPNAPRRRYQRLSPFKDPMCLPFSFQGSCLLECACSVQRVGPILIALQWEMIPLFPSSEDLTQPQWGGVRSKRQHLEPSGEYIGQASLIMIQPPRTSGPMFSLSPRSPTASPTRNSNLPKLHFLPVPYGERSSGQPGWEGCDKPPMKKRGQGRETQDGL